MAVTNIFCLFCFAEVPRTLSMNNALLDQIRISLEPTGSNYDALLGTIRSTNPNESIPDFLPPSIVPIPEEFASIRLCAKMLKSAIFGSTISLQNSTIQQIEDELCRLQVSLSSPYVFMDGYFENVNVDGPRRGLDQFKYS